jgi:hypothetical protein
VRFRDEVWDLTLQDPGTEVGVELSGFCLPYSKEPGGGEPDVYVRLYLLRGQANLKIRYREFALPSPSTFDWSNRAGPGEGPESIPKPPNWYTYKTPPQTPEAQGMDQALRTFNTRLLAKDAIDVFLAEALRDPKDYNRILAVRCLGGMSDLPNLLDALENEKFFDVRLAAIGALRHLLGLGTKYDEELAKVLREKKNYSKNQAQTVLDLLHAFTPQQWSEPSTRATVVEYLTHEKLAIRQLTHTLLLALMRDGNKIAYDPAGDTRQRERGYEEWKKLVMSNRPAPK